jgi:hypothetical protein
MPGDTGDEPMGSEYLKALLAFAMSHGRTV